MSASLGPIHFWLYHKINNQEHLTKTIADFAVKHSWITNADRYTRVLPPLETVIDENNIHGWLQAQIADAETRYASLVCEILSSDSKRMDELHAAAFDFGKAHASNASDARETYKAFEDFFVNGMPCDHVNTITSQSPDQVSWEMSRDIHAQYWDDGSKPYYSIRKSVMDGMLDNTELTLQMPDTAHYAITRNNITGAICS